MKFLLKKLIATKSASSDGLQQSNVPKTSHIVHIVGSRKFLS